MAAVPLVMVLGCGLGCSEDARLAGTAIPHVEVRTVEDQNITLGPEASPKQVAFVLLRAIRDDILAGGDLEARQKALHRQLAVCDPDYIYDLYLRFYGDLAKTRRDEWVYRKVHVWAPTLGYYVDALDFDLSTAEGLMVEGGAPAEKWDGTTTHVDLTVANTKDVGAADVMVRVRLHRSGEEQGHWRVFGVGFSGRPPAGQGGGA